MYICSIHYSGIKVNRDVFYYLLHISVPNIYPHAFVCKPVLIMNITEILLIWCLKTLNKTILISSHKRFFAIFVSFLCGHMHDCTVVGYTSIFAMSLSFGLPPVRRSTHIIIIIIIIIFTQYNGETCVQPQTMARTIQNLWLSSSTLYSGFFHCLN